MVSSAILAVEVTENLSLTADADWREQGEVTVAEGVTIDIAGCQLSLSAIAGSGTITDTVGGGTVYMDVPRETSVTNVGIAFTGKLRFVKAGLGLYRQEYMYQSYEGGTLVSAGTLCGKENDYNDGATRMNWGKSGTEIRVERDATFDLWNSCNNCYWRIVLNGGLLKLKDYLKNPPGDAQIQYLTLLADSRMHVMNSGFIGAGYRVCNVDLGGHELSVYCEGGNVVYIFNTNFVTPGTLRFTNAASGAAGGWFWMNKTSVDASKVKIINPGTSRFEVPSTVMDFEGARCDNRKSTLTVLGRYKSTGATIPHVILADGATLDLTNKSGAWDLTNASLGGSITFASGATVTVDLFGRADLADIVSGDGYVLKWASVPTDATLVPDAATATAYTLTPDETGLKIAMRSGIAKTAVWTGAASDGDWSNTANWTCTDFDDQPVTAIPCSLTTVTFSGESLPTVPGSQLGYGNISGTINLTGDLDWRGLSHSVFAEGLMLDLRGHKLTLSALRGSVAAGATITDNFGSGELHLDVSADEELVGDTVRLAGSLKVVKEGAGVFMPYLDNQTYTGGMDVREGVLKFKPANSVSSCGNETGTIRVETGALLDFNGATSSYLGNRPFVLAGGDFINNGTDIGLGNAQLANLTLEADAVLDKIDVIGGGYKATSVNLGGHTLTLTGDEAYIFNCTLSNGTIQKKHGFICADKTKFSAPTVNFDLDCMLQPKVNMELGDLVMRYTGTDVPGNASILIHGTYSPYSNYIHNYRLLNGSAIDLSMRSEPFNMTSATTGRTLAIDANANVLVKLGERPLVDGEKLIAWDESDKPTSSVKFMPDVSLKQTWKFSARGDGLYAIYCRSLCIYIR